MKKLFFDLPVFQRVIVLVLAGALVLGLTTLVGVQLVRAEPVPIWACTEDFDGSNDHPGQQDMTQMCNDVNPANANTFGIIWNWDDIVGPGGNKFFSCALFDTDQDGNANNAVCVQIIGNGSDLLEKHSYSYTCGDDKTDRCTNPVETLNDDLCYVDQLATDPFPGDLSTQDDPGGMGNSYPYDTVATCSISNTTVGGPNAVLTNVCSFTSDSSPNSAPFDCIAPTTGVKAFLTIIKNAEPNVSLPFTFTTTKTGEPSTTTTLYGTSADTIIVDPGVYTVTETSIPTGWELLSSSCTINSGTPTGTTNNISISSNDDVVCTFTNTANVDLAVTKEDGDYAPYPYPTVGTPYKYTITVTNAAGGATAYAAKMRDTLDPYLDYLSDTSTYPYVVKIDGSVVARTCTWTDDAIAPTGAGGTFECGLGDLTAGQVVTIEYWVAAVTGVPTAGIIESGNSCTVADLSDICNTVNVSTTSHDTNSTNNVASEPKDIGAPTAVELQEFKGTGAKNSVILEWTTANEFDILGYNLYRSGRLDGTRKLVNDVLIQARNPGMLEGFSYMYTNEGLKAKKFYYFWLEEVDLDGNTFLHGPIHVKAKKR